MISFEHGPTLEQPVGRGRLTTVGISWRTTNADYVQIRYPCTKFLYASTVQPSSYGLGECGGKTGINLPSNGSMSLLLSNYNPAPVELLLTLEPFLDGVEYPKESKTISISAPVSPHAPPLQDNEKASKPLIPDAKVRTLTGYLKRIGSTNKYWLVSESGWQWVVRSDSIDLSAYVDETVKITAVKADRPPDLIVTTMTTVSERGGVGH